MSTPLKFNNKLLMATLDEYVSGHYEAKKALIVMLNRAKLRCVQKYERLISQEYLVNPLKVLLVGASGTGKTHLINTIQKISNAPLIKLDATNLNPSGASGGVKAEKISEMVYKEARECARRHPEQFPYVEYAFDQAVVYVDEIDKLGTSFESSGNWNKHVQSNFLNIFDNKDELSGVSFVFSGAFDAITRKKEVKNSIGFTKEDYKASKQILDDEIIKNGIIPELLGRINTIIKLDEFSIADYIEIIESRLLPKKRVDLACFGVFHIDITYEQIEDLATRACNSGQGVRYLQREIDRMFLDLEYHLDDYEGEQFCLEHL